MNQIFICLWNVSSRDKFDLKVSASWDSIIYGTKARSNCFHDFFNRPTLKEYRVLPILVV
jgi:hypothetical protein